MICSDDLAACLACQSFDTLVHLRSTSILEYRSLLQSVYPGPHGALLRFNNFQQVLNANPCTSLTLQPNSAVLPFLIRAVAQDPSKFTGGTEVFPAAPAAPEGANDGMTMVDKKKTTSSSQD
jgi:hypothetical protein